VHPIARDECGEIAVRQECVDRQKADVLVIRCLVLVDQREKYFGADVGRARTVAACRIGHEPSFAPRRKVATVVAFIVVQRLVQRAELKLGRRRGHTTVYGFHREHLVIEGRKPRWDQMKFGFAR